MYRMNMTTNTQVPFEMTTHSIPFLKESSSSNIVNISSVNGKQAFVGCATYCMSKAALDQLTRCASVDLAKYGIRVNAINPGVIETNLQKVIISAKDGACMLVLTLLNVQRIDNNFQHLQSMFRLAAIRRNSTVHS